MKGVLCSVILCLLQWLVGAQRRIVVENILKYGYPVEEHKNIQTEDGYLLDMQRIPHGLNSTTSTKPPVLIVHGLGVSAEVWVMLGPQKSLAFALADLGYDVWLGNCRGSNHSRKHILLNPDTDQKFWDYSWQEIGLYDLPAKINYITKTTGFEKMFYIGHSQGTSGFFVMASERPEFNDRIRLMVALAPPIFLKNPGNPFLNFFGNVVNGFHWLLSRVAIFEAKQFDLVTELSGRSLCLFQSLYPELCNNLVFLLGGYDTVELDKSDVPAILESTPATASTKQVIHYTQSVPTGTFKYYDYGFDENLRRYKSKVPPDFKLHQVTAPVAVFYANHDGLVPIPGVQKLVKALPNVIYHHLIQHPKFTHLDFLIAKSIPKLVSLFVINLMQMY